MSTPGWVFRARGHRDIAKMPRKNLSLCLSLGERSTFLRRKVQAPTCSERWVRAPKLHPAPSRNGIQAGWEMFLRILSIRGRAEEGRDLLPSRQQEQKINEPLLRKGF